MRNKIPDNQRVVVTGLGVVSSLGIGWQEFWKNLIAGKSGISRVEAFDTSQYDRHYGGEVKNFDPLKFMTKRQAASMGRASQMAVAAAKLAVDDAKVALKDLREKKVAVCIGTTMGELREIEKENDKKINNSVNNNIESFFSYAACNISDSVASYFKSKGRSLVFSTACAAGNYAIGYGVDLLKKKRLDYVIAGGADSFSRVVFTGFSRTYSMAPEKCQPFDKNRLGMISAEGSGIIMLETLEHAYKRKATIWAEVLGIGQSCDAQHITNPSADGIARAIKKAMMVSRVSSNQIDYFCAHGTGTKENDKAECLAFRNIFKTEKKVFVTSIKSMLGHSMGAASALEAISCCLTIKNGVIPPTINLMQLDEDCRVDCVANDNCQYIVETVLNNSSAFGGNNACLVLAKNK